MRTPPLRLRPEIEAHPLWPAIMQAYQEHRDLDVAELVGMIRFRRAWNRYLFGKLINSLGGDEGTIVPSMEAIKQYTDHVINKTTPANPYKSCAFN